MRSRSVETIVLMVLSLCSIAAGEATAQCNWEADATASVTAYDGRIESNHRGVLTRVDCVNSRQVILRMATLQNGYQVWEDDKEGGAAVLGASIFDSIGFASCLGRWNSTTRFGTTYLNLDFWIDDDVSGFVDAYCSGGDGGGGGGGGGVSPCSAGTFETTTWSLAMDSEPVESASQTGYGLWRSVERPEGSFLMDEWAIVSWRGAEPTLKFSSTEEFKEIVRDHVSSYRPRGRGSDIVLVVEANDHPRNRRFIPTPVVQPIETVVDWPQRSNPGEFWFRAEVAETGEVDRLLLLDSSDSFGATAVRSALKENLRLQYADSRRHRAVVFGRAEVNRDGRLRVRDGFVALPQCCCGTNEAFCV